MSRIKINEPLIRWLGIPVVALFSILANPEHAASKPFWENFATGLIMTIIYWNGAFYIITFFRKQFPQINQTKKRIIYSALAIIFWITFGGLPVKLLLGLNTLSEIQSLNEFTHFLPFSFTAAILVSLCYEAVYFFDKWKETFKQNQDLKHQQIRTQFEVLQNQMSPHFLFNSLNALTTLIAENQDTAIEFTQKLSEVYRYILQTKDKELVRLSEEIEFSKAYLFLLKMRYPENLQFEFEVDKKYLDEYVAPLTIQMLVENAIKHNKISKSAPLKIHIYVENGVSIVVKNNLQLKNTLEKSTKTGLANIKKRYQLLGNREVDIITTAKNFMVAVPLIKLMEDTELNLSS